jgi:hypothetical protein
LYMSARADHSEAIQQQYYIIIADSV